MHGRRRAELAKLVCYRACGARAERACAGRGAELATRVHRRARAAQGRGAGADCGGEGRPGRKRREAATAVAGGREGEEEESDDMWDLRVSVWRGVL